MQKIRKFRSKSIKFLLILPVAVLMIMAACTVEKPQAPSWLTTWDIPISNKTFSISDLLENIGDSLITFDSLGNPGFSITQGFDTVSVANNLTVAGINLDIRDSLGIIDIDPPGGATASTNINDFLTVNFGVVPPVSFGHSQNLSAISNFTWMDVQSGTLDLTFSNYLEVDLDTLIVTVVDLADSHTVGTAVYANGLTYLEQETQSIDLSGQTISNSLAMDFQGYTAGGVLLYAGPQSLDADMSFPSTITVVASRAEIPEIIKSQSRLTAIGDSTNITTSSISAGSAQFDISNGTELPLTIDITSANFTLGGSPMLINQLVSGNSAVQVIVDLAGYQFSPVDSPSTQYIDIEFTATVPASAPTQYTVAAGDSIGIGVNVADITFQSITGRVKPTAIVVDPIQQNLDIPQGLDQAMLTQAELNLNLYNNSTADSDVDLIIIGGGKSIDIAGRIAGKSSPGASPRLTTLEVSSQELSDFLNPPPSDISISGSAVLNPDYAVVTITADDNFYGEVQIYSPIALAIYDSVSIETDISETEIDKDSRPDNFQDTFRYGAINIDFDSHLPLGISMTIYIGTLADSTLYDNPGTLILGPYTLLPGTVDNNGHVIESALSNISDSLSSAQLAIFDTSMVYVGQKINLLPTDSTGVQVLGTDYINIRSNARIQVKVGDNMWN